MDTFANLDAFIESGDFSAIPWSPTNPSAEIDDKPPIDEEHSGSGLVVGFCVIA